MAVSITVSGPRSTRTYSSIAKAARTLSGTGTSDTSSLEKRIATRVRNGGGYVGRLYVRAA